MRVKAQRWGTSIAVRIPKGVAEATSVKEQGEMDIEVRDGASQLRPRGRGPSLDDLLVGITPENLHSEMDFGWPEGREAW